MKLALAQINPTIGDFSGNSRKIIDTAREADSRGADLAIFPELAICGYPPADLLEKPSFVARTQEALREIAEQATAGREIAVLCGCVTPAAESSGKRVMNSAALLRQGRVEFMQSKMLLPYYDVFDEQRYFAPATSQRVFDLGGERLGITICEDAWNDKNFWRQRLYPVDPVENLVQQGATLLLNISASPFSRGKRQTRHDMLAAIAQRYRLPVAMVNQVGGNDSLIFDGSSLAMDATGTCIAQARSFEEDLVVVDMAGPPATGVARSAATVPTGEEGAEDEAVYRALVLGTRDYVRKCGFAKAIVGLSGGIDSALVAAIAVDALGSENVLGVGMPSQYSSQGSIDDAEQLSRNLGIAWALVPIQGIFDANLRALRPQLHSYPPDVTEENLQSRVRGTLLMAMSNKLSALVLTTGNKSEMSTGYCTLYGDMVGALAVIADVYKTQVYRLARYVNRERQIVPQNTLMKPPSAELRPGQKDTDSLPPYEVLDPILEAYVEHYATIEKIVEASRERPSGAVSAELARKVLRLVERSEYKRQQAAPVLKVTQKSFGSGRRFPVAVKAEL
ncbi:MAG: NAD+ synthase [Acidobacteriaceae bacterium]